MNSSAFLPRQPSKLSVQVLDTEHHRILVHAIRHVLSTELAELTMAQLVDGLPLASSGWDARGSLILAGHPLTKHEALCDGVMSQTKAFWAAFNSEVLQFDSPVCTSLIRTNNGWTPAETFRSYKHIKAPKLGLSNSRCA
jgi:hypothetical protein